MSRVIIALDFKNKDEALTFLDKFPTEKLYVKVGMELFYSEGHSIIEEIKKRGHQIFLDLKLHDIPNTVKSAMYQLAKLDVDMVNVHASGGTAMMKAAIDGLENGKVKEARPLCIAVTCLTSLDDAILHKELLINHSVKETALTWARNARLSGMDGVVCSPLESLDIHRILSEDFLTVTPGIRFADGDVNDQKRVATPEYARTMTSSYIVVGRAITGAANPVEAYKEAVRQFEGE